MTRLASLACLLALLASCGTDSEWCSLTGKWQGTWKSRFGVSGSLASTLAQQGDNVTGSVAFTNSPCFDAANVALVEAGGNITGSATAGGIRVDMSASWVEDHLEGTYNAISAGACTGDTGTFSMQRN